MQVNELKNKGLEREYEVVVSAAEIAKEVDARLKDVGATIKMPGFRPGKVPLDILRKRYGKAVLGEVLEKVVNDTTANLMQEKKLRPAMQPKIEVKEFDEGKDLTYTVALEVMPEFEVMDLKTLKLTKPVAAVEDAQVDEALGRIATQRRQNVKIEEDRPAKKGDVVVIDFKGRTADDNVEHPQMQGSSHSLEIGSGQFIPGFEDQLVGAKAGTTLDVKLSFPEDYHADDFAGRAAIFETTVKEIRLPQVPEIDEDFAKSLGLDDLNALREVVKEQIDKEYEESSRLKVKRALLDVLDEKHSMDLPGSMVDMEYDSILQQVLHAKGHKPHGDGEGESPAENDSVLEQDEKEELRQIAERRVRLGLLLSQVGQKNNITVGDHELQGAVIREAQKYPGQERAVFDFYSKNRQALESLRAPLYEEKVVDFILELADVTMKDVTIDELLAEDEDDLPKALRSKEENADASNEKKDKKPAKKPAAKTTKAKAADKEGDEKAEKPKAQPKPKTKAKAKKASSK